MASQARINANRRNAQKSTWPKTEAGKARAKLNALKDGKHAKTVSPVLPQENAAELDGRFVTVGPLALFSTDTGDAWLLDSEDHLAARLARDGDPEEIHFEETDTRFAIRLEGQIPN